MRGMLAVMRSVGFRRPGLDVRFSSGCSWRTIPGVRMNSSAATNIVTKLLAINLIIAVIVGGCIWFAQSRMVVIDAIYTNLIAREAKAVSNVRGPIA